MALGQPGKATAVPGHVLIAMGDQGLASRVLSTRIGNRWTYAGDNVAPGQVSAQRMLDEFRFRDLRPGTAVYGVVGNPVMHSLSPVMHNAGFRHYGIDAVYLPLLAKDAADFVAFARWLGLAGASITAPFKVHLMDAVDELEPLAQPGWRDQHADRARRPVAGREHGCVRVCGAPDSEAARIFRLKPEAAKPEDGS